MVDQAARVSRVTTFSNLAFQACGIWGRRCLAETKTREPHDLHENPLLLECLRYFVHSTARVIHCSYGGIRRLHPSPSPTGVPEAFRPEHGGRGPVPSPGPDSPRKKTWERGDEQKPGSRCGPVSSESCPGS